MPKKNAHNIVAVNITVHPPTRPWVTIEELRDVAAMLDKQAINDHKLPIIGLQALIQEDIISPPKE